jgi:hypothetical protein
MRQSVQDIVTEALKAGLKIPESMRPIIQAMIDAGLLTDEFGNKLTDLGGIDFEVPLTERIGELVDALMKLIDTLSNVGDEARRARGELEAVGTAVPRGSTGTSTPAPGPTPSPAPTGTSGTGTSIPRRRYATGGIVGRVLSFPQPSGMDRVPVLAAPGEAFLNVPAVQAIGRPAIDALNHGWSMSSAHGSSAASDAAGISAGHNITIHISAMDGPSVKRVVASPEFAEELSRQLQLNPNGIGTAVRRVTS